MLRKSVAIFTVFALIFGVAGMALAANRVEVKVTSEPIPLKSPCSKAGGFSMEFDEGTILEAGDRITMDTQFGTTICRSFDIMISPDNDVQLDANGNYLSGSLWGDPLVNAASVLPYPRGSAAFSQTVPGTVAGSTGVVFRIRGIAGTQRLTVDILGPVGNTLVVTNADINTPDVVVLNFMDQRTNPLATIPAPNPVGPIVYVNPATWEVGTTARLYNDSADWNDNTLCIDISSDIFTATTVNANLDSRNDKFTFIPSNPQIAHVAQPLNVDLFPCKTDAAPDNIVIPDEQGACIFNYQTGSGYCTGRDLGRRIVFRNLGDFFDNTRDYSVRLEILSPNNFVYWSGGSVGYAGQKTATCETGAPAGTLNLFKAYNRNGAELTGFTGTGGACTIPDAQKAVTVETEGGPVFTAADNRAVWLNLPSLVFDRDNIQAGTEVRVRVTLQTFPCGTIHSEIISLGVFGCETAPGVVGNTLIYPYFTAAADAGWWNGIVVTNLSSTAGTARVFMYEADGDRATLTLPVPANGQAIGLLENLLDSMTVTTNVNGIGNSSSYIVVCTDFLADGFAMIANDSADPVNGSESMGYIPRFERSLPVCR